MRPLREFLEVILDRDRVRINMETLCHYELKPDGLIMHWSTLRLDVKLMPSGGCEYRVLLR
jgi:hypothetical protein